MKQSNGLPIKVDEKYILEKCHELLKEAGVENPPVDPRILASFRGVDEVIEDDIEEAGVLLPINGTFKILLRKIDCEGRKRFTCCHEVVHTFMPEFQLKPQKRVDHETGQYHRKDVTEYLCDYGAAELLMPSYLFAPRFSEYGFNVGSLQKLSEEFLTSLEATALKMVKQNPKKYALVIWEETYKPTEINNMFSQRLPGFESPLPEMKLRIQLGFGFDGFFHIPKHKSIDEDLRIIQNSFLEGEKQSGEEIINFGRLSVKCMVHTMPIVNSKKILTLLEKK